MGSKEATRTLETADGEVRIISESATGRTTVKHANGNHTNEA